VRQIEKGEERKLKNRCDLEWDASTLYRVRKPKRMA